MEYSISEPLAPEKATEVINEITTYADCIVDLTSHCQEKMLERGFDFQDILLILSNGTVNSLSEYDNNHKHYKYKVEGSTLDGDDAVIVTIILDSRTLRVVTIYQKGGQP